MNQIPQILKEIITSLVPKSNQCMLYNMSRGMTEVCNKDMCPRLQQLNDKVQNKKAIEITQELKNKDIYSNPKNVDDIQLQIRNKQAMEFAQELKNKGYNYISIGGQDPVYIFYCNQDSGSKK
jgi:hypothetical protein